MGLGDGMMDYSLAVVTAPTAEPVTTAEAKLHCRVDHPDEDTYIGSLITAARVYSEQYTGRAFVNTTFDMKIDSFPGGGYCPWDEYAPWPDTIYIPRPLLQSVTSITYTDTDGTSQTFSSSLYSVDTSSLPGRITLAYGESYPATRQIHHAVTIRFVGGYGSAASNVPQTIKQAVLLLVGHWYENRETSVTGTMHGPVLHAVDNLLWSERVKEIL